MLKRMDQYQHHYGLKVRIYPSTAQKQVITASSDASRFVYNKMVEIGREISCFGKPAIYIKVVDERLAWLKDLGSSTTTLKNTYPWLCAKDVDSLAIANAKQSYKTAWNMYRKVYRIATPKFHKKSNGEKYQTTAQYNKKKISIANMSNGTCRFSRNHVVLPVLGKIRYAASRRMMAKFFAMREIRIGTITIRKNSCDEYYASFNLASDEAFVTEAPKTGSQVGIDLNVENFYADSDGHIVPNPHYYRNAKKRLAKAQRILCRRAARAKKEHRPLGTAKNYQKQRKLVAKITQSVMNRRRNFLHNQSTALIKNHDLVVAEELRSRSMMRNHAFAMSIQDNGWRTFLNMMAYKAAWYGKTFRTVNPRNTTQTCSACGHVLTGEHRLTLKVRKWTCPICGVHHASRDVNSAKNILAKGLA